MNRILRAHANNLIFNINLKEQYLLLFKEVKTENVLNKRTKQQEYYHPKKLCQSFDKVCSGGIKQPPVKLV